MSDSRPTQPTWRLTVLILSSACILFFLPNVVFALDLSVQGQHGRAETRQSPAGPAVPTACLNHLADQKIAILFTERLLDGRVDVRQQRYAGVFPIVARAFQGLGLTVSTQEEIDAKIAQEQIEAIGLRNDSRAAITAARRLGANFVLRTHIDSVQRRHARINVEIVSTSLAFSLSGSNGAVYGTVHQAAQSYSGRDGTPIIRDLVSENASVSARRLLAQYCERTR